MTAEAITLPESRQLISLESKIEAGRKTFVEVGLALAEIRDQRLYRADYATFEDYCKQKWQWSKQHVYNLIECAPIAKSNPQITSLNQARVIAQVPPANRAAVLEKATSQGKVTAKAIQEAIEVEKPLTLESQFKSATAGLKLPQDEPVLTPLQNMCVDADYVFAQAKETLSTADLAKFKLHVEVSLRKLRP